MGEKVGMKKQGWMRRIEDGKSPDEELISRNFDDPEVMVATFPKSSLSELFDPAKSDKFRRDETVWRRGLACQVRGQASGGNQDLLHVLTTRIRLNYDSTASSLAMALFLCPYALACTL